MDTPWGPETPTQLDFFAPFLEEEQPLWFDHEESVPLFPDQPDQSPAEPEPTLDLAKAPESDQKASKEEETASSQKPEQTSDSIEISHIMGETQINVTQTRLNRILARRPKRLAFLAKFPRFTQPYKYRQERQKVSSRVHAGKYRKRLEDGKFVPKAMQIAAEALQAMGEIANSAKD